MLRWEAPGTNGATASKPQKSSTHKRMTDTRTPQHRVLARTRTAASGAGEDAEGSIGCWRGREHHKAHSQQQEGKGRQTWKSLAVPKDVKHTHTPEITLRGVKSSRPHTEAYTRML